MEYKPSLHPPHPYVSPGRSPIWRGERRSSVDDVAEALSYRQEALFG